VRVGFGLPAQDSITLLGRDDLFADPLPNERRQIRHAFTVRPSVL
jgi:hypothetical protein